MRDTTPLYSTLTVYPTFSISFEILCHWFRRISTVHITKLVSTPASSFRDNERKKMKCATRAAFRYYLKLIEVLLKLPEGLFERIDGRARAWTSLAREDDLFLVNQGAQTNLELRLFLQIEGVNLGKKKSIKRYPSARTDPIKHMVSAQFPAAKRPSDDTLLITILQRTFSSSRSNLKKKAAF